MPQQHVRLKWKRYLLRILLPTALAISLFVGFIFWVIIPDVEANLLERKREMIRELTHSAISIAKEYLAEEQSGKLTRQEAQSAAALRLKDLRYGPEAKDYFWVTDTRPVMVMHPFREDLNGKDVSDFRDPLGNPVFVEFVNKVKAQGSGYVDYVWQWKDDPSRLVAKESFVMAFPEWDWVVGTGIYTDDVNAEIAVWTKRLITISLLIVAVIALIMGFVAWQSLKIERQRLLAEDALRASHEKYRALVEAAADGTLMILEGRCSFANRTLQKMLGYSADELANLPFEQLFLAPDAAAEAAQYVHTVVEQQPAPPHIETLLRRQDGSPLETILSASRAALGEQVGAIVNVRDLSANRTVEAELGYNRERYRLLRESIDVGVARTSVGKPARVIEANSGFGRILGFEPTDDLSRLDLWESLVDPEVRRTLRQELNKGGAVRNRQVAFLRKDGSNGLGRLTAVVVRDELGQARFCDVLFEDLSQQQRTDAEREALIAELQTSLLFLNEPLKRYAKETATCDLTTPIRQASQRMAHGAILVTTESREPVGLVTDRDLRERVVAQGLEFDAPVFRVMSAPLVAVSEKALVYEALQVMREKGFERLAIKDETGKVLGMVRHSDLSQYHRYSSAVLVQEIRKAESVEELAELHARVPLLVRTLIDCGAKPRNVNRVITGVSDAITERLVALATARLGPPPARFAFVALGSEGRQEQTLLTDQDNAILIEPIEQESEAVLAYFRQMGTFVCDGLNTIGYSWCQGEVMAKNPKWCQPVTQWTQYFTQWITTRNPQDLLQVHMFFDFRCIVGDRSLTGTLRKHIQAELARNPAFFPLMAQDAMARRPQAALFGGIPTTDGKSGRTLNLKDAMMPFVAFARLYCLRHDVADTNTFDRLKSLNEKGVLTDSSLAEIVDAYAFLMQTRLRHQVAAVEQGEAPSNAIHPKSLSPSEETLLKRTLAHISVLVKKVGFDFLGSQQIG